MSANGHRDREQAIAAADSTCPRCGTPRAADQQYCLECGLPLPNVSGRVPSLRRRWIRRLGWYPGDWMWVSLLTLLVAVAGATAAIVLTKQASAEGNTFEVPPPVVSTVGTPTTPPPTTTVVQPTTTTTTKTPPKKPPTKPAPANGRLTWPARTNGWTIVLVSYPKTIGQAAAAQTAERAAKSGLTKVGVLDSSRYASLQPGYFVVFTGVYGSKADADGAVATARQAGFGGAYTRQVAS